MNNGGANPGKCSAESYLVNHGMQNSTSTPGTTDLHVMYFEAVLFL